MSDRCVYAPMLSPSIIPIHELIRFSWSRKSYQRHTKNKKNETNTARKVEEVEEEDEEEKKKF